MSTKTTFKRLALVTVAALGLGVLSVAPSNASIQAEQLAVSATTVSTTAGTAGTVVVTHSFLGNAVADTVTATASIVKMPAGNSVLPTWSTTSTATDVGSPNKIQSGLVASTGVSAGATATFYSAGFTLSFNPTVAGEYIIRVTASGAGVATKDITYTVAAKTIGLSTAWIGSTVAVETPTADATIAQQTAAASGTAKARITVASFYGTTAVETASAADAKEVIVATTKGLISKTNDYTAGSKSVTTAAATAAATNYWLFSNGDVGVASITITVGGVLLATKTVTFIGAPTALVATVASGNLGYTGIGASKTTVHTITSTDSALTTVTNPSGLTAVSSDTSVATVVQTNNTTTTVTGVKAGTAVITVTDPATSGAAKAVSYTVTVKANKPLTAPTITFDKASYAVGEVITMVVGADMADSASAQLFTGALVTSSAVVTAAGGTALPTGGLHAIVSGVATYKFYAPVVSGTFTITGTAGSDVDLTTLVTAPVVAKTVDITNASVDAAAAAAEEAIAAANDATDAALSAAEAAEAATAMAQEAVDAVAELSASVTKLIGALRAQITSLTNLIVKIQKKVKA